MANETIDKKIEKAKDLPSTVQGNGQNFIYLLKKYLEQLTKEVNDKFVEVSKMYNAINDSPEEVEEQIQDLRLKEKRIGTSTSLVLTWNSKALKQYSGANVYIYEQKTAPVLSWDDSSPTRTVSTPLLSSYVVENVSPGYTYKIVVQGRTTLGSVSRRDKCPAIVHAVSAVNNVPEPPIDFHCYINREGIKWTWKQEKEHESYVTELRLDQNPGNNTNLLEVTQDTFSVVQPNTREGTAYLYNKGYGDKYSEPVTTRWSKSVPTAPQGLRVTPVFQGLKIDYGRIPDDCQSICISINGELHYSSDDSFSYNCSSGNYVIKAAYHDLFGNGTWTEGIAISTMEEIPPNAVHVTDKTVFDNGVIVAKYIGDRAVVGTKISDGAISTDKLSANAVTSDKVAANAIRAENIESNAITSDKIHAGAITSDKIDVGAITAEKIGVGAVTANKIAAEEISMNGKLKISGGSVTLSETGLNVKQNDGSSITFNGYGMVSNDTNGNSFNIASAQIIGECENGDYVKFKNPWPYTPMVTVVPKDIQVSSATYPQADVKIHSYATELTNKGFRVNCYSGILNGTGVLMQNVPILHKTYPENNKPQHWDNGHVMTDTNSYTFTCQNNVETLDISVELSLTSTCVGNCQCWWERGTAVSIYKNDVVVNTQFLSEDIMVAGGYGQYDMKASVGTKSRIFTKRITVKAADKIRVEVKNICYFNSGKYYTNGGSCVKIQADINNIITKVNGEQALDNKGKAVFIVNNNNNNNYTIE